ncbi:MAG: hypothetical protein R3B52_02520 [Candidatus Paceibacterota bacterium]
MEQNNQAPMQMPVEPKKSAPIALIIALSVICLGLGFIGGKLLTSPEPAVEEIETIPLTEQAPEQKESTAWSTMKDQNLLFDYPVGWHIYYVYPGESGFRSEGFMNSGPVYNRPIGGSITPITWENYSNLIKVNELKTRSKYEETLVKQGDGVEVYAYQYEYPGFDDIPAISKGYYALYDKPELSGDGSYTNAIIFTAHYDAEILSEIAQTLRAE